MFHCAPPFACFPSHVLVCYRFDLFVVFHGHWDTWSAIVPDSKKRQRIQFFFSGRPVNFPPKWPFCFNWWPRPSSQFSFQKAGMFRPMGDVLKRYSFFTWKVWVLLVQKSKSFAPVLCWLFQLTRACFRWSLKWKAWSHRTRFANQAPHCFLRNAFHTHHKSFCPHQMPGCVCTCRRKTIARCCIVFCVNQHKNRS